MAMIQTSALLLASAIGFLPATVAPPGRPVSVTVRQVLTTQALKGARVLVSGRCLDADAPALARGSRPFSGRVWQLEDNGVATWVVGRMPESCKSGTATITATVSQDTLPRLSRPRTLRQYLVVAGKR